MRAVSIKLYLLLFVNTFFVFLYVYICSYELMAKIIMISVKYVLIARSFRNRRNLSICRYFPISLLTLQTCGANIWRIWQLIACLWRVAQAVYSACRVKWSLIRINKPTENNCNEVSIQARHSSAQYIGESQHCFALLNHHRTAWYWWYTA